MLRAVYTLKEVLPNVKLLLVGTGPREKYYRDLCSELMLDEHVEFLGYRDDIPNLMMLADIGVSSARQEGLPVNVMEAMATGLPIVATDVRGNRDLVTDGLNGFLVDSDDHSSFAKAVYELAKSPKLRTDYGQESLRLIQRFSLDAVISQMGDVYTNVIRCC